jgi:predicted metalloprotease
MVYDTSKKSSLAVTNLQMKYQGRVVPDAFTHGSASQRKEWFRRGWQSGDFEDGDTLNSSI